MRRLCLAAVVTLTASLTGQETLALWPNAEVPEGAAPRTAQERGTAAQPNRFVRNVHAPTLTVHLPPAAEANGAAVVICPGGGYAGLAIDKEGHEIARFLVSLGVAGLVLEYRLPRPEGHVYGHEVPAQDARRALALARENAAAWRLAPDRIGLMGFSAGGHLASTVGTHPAEPRERPDFLGLIYPVISFGDDFGHRGSRNRLLGQDAPAELVQAYSNETRVTDATPPTFLLSTSDDFVRPANAIAFAQALHAAGVSCELHVYARGGHGYGLRKGDQPIGGWPQRFAEWLGDQGLLRRDR